MVEEQEKPDRAATETGCPEAMEGVDLANPPQTAEEWVNDFRMARDGTRRARAAIKYVRANMTALKKDFSTKELVKQCKAAAEPIDDRSLDKFLHEKGGLKPQHLEILVRYLHDKGVLKPLLKVEQKQAGILNNLSNSLSAFLAIAQNEISELAARAAGEYWIYRPSIHHPGAFYKGGLSVRTPKGGENFLRVVETYRHDGSGDAEHGFEEVYEGIMLQKARYPFVLTALRLDEPPAVPPGDHTESDRGSLRITSIGRAAVNRDGQFSSMTGLASVSQATGGLINAPICFERIPASFTGDVRDAFRIVEPDGLPKSVLARLSSVYKVKGLIRL